MGNCLFSKKKSGGFDSDKEIDFTRGNVHVITCKESWDEKILEANKYGKLDLGIGAISESLMKVVNNEHKALSHRTNSKQKKGLENSELRRSSRARNIVSSYNDDRVDDLDLRSYRKRYGRTSYTGVRTASYEEHIRALARAEKIQDNLNSGNPSFIKSMVRSHVSSCFWLGLPSRFCQDHLPSGEVKMVLEDENGSEYEAIYIGRRTGLSGGWKGFSVDHRLDDGDVLLFELCQPSKFKVYIVKAIDESRGDNDDRPSDTDMEATDRSGEGKLQTRTGSSKRVKRRPKRSDLM